MQKRAPKRLSARRKPQSARSRNRHNFERRSERSRALSLLRGLHAEISENVDARPWNLEALDFLFAPFVRDFWSVAKPTAADLPDEALDAARSAYALAAIYNGLVGWIRLWGYSHEFGVVNVKQVYVDRVRTAGREAHEAFVAAAEVMRHWIRMKESDEDVTVREKTER